MANTLKFGNGEWYGKQDTILAYNDENSNYKPLPFDYERGSTATRINKEGLIETVGANEPRIDYKDDVKGALLLEPSRTNSLLQSNQFDTTWSTSSGVTILSEQTISPDGNNNGWKFEKTAASYKSIGQSYTSSSETTFSIFAKKGTLNIITLFCNISGATNLYQRFDLENGIISTGSGMSSSNMEDYGNGWYKCSSTFTNANVTSLDYFPDFAEINSGYIYIFGAQAEQGSYSTSLINTQGTVQTRLADECEQTPPDGVIGQTELTIFYQGIVERLGGNDGHAITLSQSADGAGSSRVLLYRNSSNGNMYVYIQDTTTQFSTPLLANSNPQINDKYAIAIKDNDLVVYCNGVKVSENNYGTIPATQYLILNKWNNQINEQNKIKEVKLYNTRLSNSELAALTQV